MTKDQVSTPFFTIGLPTYNRIQLLRRTLFSIINQDFKSFEIIVGNDYILEPLTNEFIGINDERIIIVNNIQNLGERENMNSLLKIAKGQYFTWIFDDDLYAPNFLSSSYNALLKSDFPECVFTSFNYMYGKSDYIFKRNIGDRTTIYSGRDFLRAYLGGIIRVVGLCGCQQTEYLRKIGGAVKLTEGKMGVYAEVLLIFRAGLLSKVAYVNEMLVANRVHEDSYSCKSTEADIYKEAGIQLIRESILIFSAESLKEDFVMNLTSLLKSVISVVITKSKIGGVPIRKIELSEYISAIKVEFEPLKKIGLYDNALTSLNAAKNGIFLYRIKAFLKTLLSFKQLKYAHIALSYISKYTNKSF